MVAEIIEGPKKWSGERDDQGYRDFHLQWRVACDRLDGPYTVMNCPGLPAVGSIYNFDNDLDPFAFCHPQMKVDPILDGEPNTQFLVDQLFSTRPLTTCQDPPIDDPLLQPMKVSGSFVKYTKEITRNRNGTPTASSSHEPFRGKIVEFDHNRPTVKISQNVPNLELATFSEMIDHLNDAPLWGLPPRCIKLSNAPWERAVNGTCGFYYVRNFEFDIDFATFDRYALDEGSKVLHGHWSIAPGTGTGCTLNIVATTASVTAPDGTLSYAGEITSATLGAGGSGYAESATIQLSVVQTGGKGGVVAVTTNASGTVTGVSSVINKGMGYVSGSGIATSSASSWILDNINGSPPNKNNPQHFQRFKDRKGENCRVALNGGGCPLTSANPDDAWYAFISHYPEANFLLLGIPTTL